MKKWCLPLLVFFVCAAAATHAAQERRVALVIGNGAYKAAPLKNPVNDARDMAQALQELGFDVTLKLNAGHKEMEEAVREFGQKIKHGGVGLFYFAGHGLQVAGENYLVPAGAAVASETEVKFKCLAAGFVLGKMFEAKNGLNIVILDACRDNPFARSFRSGAQGLAKMDAPKGTIVAYATSPGEVAADGSGRNGLYTGQMLKHVRTPGLKVEDVMKRVRADVVAATGEKQIPWESSSLIGDFYFAAPSLGQEVQAGTPSPPLPAAQAVGKAPETAESQRMYENGIRAYEIKNYTEAAKWFRLAAEQGYAKAQSNIGVMYYTGQGVPKNYSEAVKWFRLAAGQGHDYAQLSLGLMYNNGQGVPKNITEAAKLYRVAAEHGNAPAQFALGWMYANGNGVPSDNAEAVKWFRLAADQGNAFAQFSLGVMYNSGQGVQKNYADALKWFHLSAEQGEARAQAGLGAMYGLGQGVTKNYVHSYMWVSLAAAQGNANAVEFRDLIASEMTLAQVAAAQKLAAEWRPKTPEELGFKPAGVPQE